MSKGFMKNVFRILNFLYYTEKPEKITEKIKSNMTSEEFENVMVFLENKGLINIKKEKSPFHVNLTDKGVEFLVNELNRKRQEEFNRIVAFTGAILALIGIYNLIIGSFSFENYPINLLIIKIIFLILLLICISPIVRIVINIWKKEVFGK